MVTPVAIGVHRVLDLFDATCAKEPPDDSDPAGTTIGDHDHATDNIGIITAGELILIISGEEHRYGPGAWYHVSPGQTHAARFETDTSEIEFWFSPRTSHSP